MFALASKTIPSLRHIGMRGFASRAIYLGNVSQFTTADQLQEIFGKYGHIEGIRLSTTGGRYRFGHVYYGAGEPEVINGEKKYMSSYNPTPEEAMEVDTAASKAVAIPSIQLDGNTVYVKHAIPKTLSKEEPRMGGSELEAYKRGFSEGYRAAKRENNSPPYN